MAVKGDKFLVLSTVPGLPDHTVIFEGIQKVGLANFPDFPLYTLIKGYKNHPEGSTVARMTLEEDGFILESTAP